MTIETFTEFWLALCNANPVLIKKCTLKLPLEKFKEILQAAFIAGTNIPMEMARAGTQIDKYQPKGSTGFIPGDLMDRGEGLQGIDKLIGHKADPASQQRADKAHDILHFCGIDPSIMFESRPFAETIIAFILGKIPEGTFLQICRDQA